MLVCHDTVTGLRLDATDIDDSTWSMLWRRRTGERLRCVRCGATVIAKVSHKHLRFFAHTSLIECPGAYESPRHLGLKNAFASALRACGAIVGLEVSGPGWRADVLATAASGQRYAVEVQCAPITPDEVIERTRRHAASGVQTIWAVPRYRRWNNLVPTVVLAPNDRVIDTVLVPREPGHFGVAAPASIQRLCERLLEGRLQPVPGEHAKVLYGHRAISGMLQLDECADAAFAHRSAQEQRRRDITDAAEAGKAAQLRIRATRREGRIELILNSMLHLRDWWAKQPGPQTLYFGPDNALEPRQAACHGDWDPNIGPLVKIGYHRPLYVLAVIEPHCVIKNQVIPLWTTGTDPLVPRSSYRIELTPETPALPAGIHSLHRVRRRR